jgi:hypothetical protein
VIRIPLNSTARAAIIAVAGNGFFSIGGSFDNISGSFAQEFLFGSTFGFGTIQLCGRLWPT